MSFGKEFAKAFHERLEQELEAAASDRRDLAVTPFIMDGKTFQFSCRFIPFLPKENPDLPVGTTIYHSSKFLEGIPWFMHTVDTETGRRNTLTGVYPVDGGVYVRSWSNKVEKDDAASLEVTFYPQEPARREPIQVYYYSSTGLTSSQMEASATKAVRMHIAKRRLEPEVS